MGKNKKNKQNKNSPKNEQKSESIKKKGKEAVSHPQNPLPQTVSDEEQHSKKEQVTQSVKNVDPIVVTPQSAVPESSHDVRNWPSLSSSTTKPSKKEQVTQSANEATAQSAVLEISQDVRSWPLLSSSTTKPSKKKQGTQSANEATAQSAVPESSQEVRNWTPSSSSTTKRSKKEQVTQSANEVTTQSAVPESSQDVRSWSSSSSSFPKQQIPTFESNKTNSRGWRTRNSNEVDVGEKDPYSLQRDSYKGNDKKKEDYPKQNNERIGRDRHFEGNRTRDHWRVNDYKSDDKGFDQFLKISKQKISEDSYKKVIEIENDLFNMSDEYCLAHCVAEDMNMGSGIAVRFSQQFKRWDELYNQRQKQGGLAILEDKGRYIYYLVTKRVSNGKPTLQTMWNSLQKLKQHIEDNNIKKLAIPRIGCGLDRLEWSEVKNMLEHTFRETDVQITVCNYQQNYGKAKKELQQKSKTKDLKQTKLDRFSEDDGPTSGLPYKKNKCIVKNVAYSIAEIESGTAIIYFGAQDGSMFDDIEDLDKKFRISMDYKNSRKQLGDVIQTYKLNKAYCLYGCIVRRTKEDPFDFINFQKCITQFKKMNKNEYYYVAFQAFLDSDDLMVTKIGNMLRCSLANIEVYVCWGGKMNDYMPQERSNNYNY